MIVAQKLTDNTTDDAGVVDDLLDRIPDNKKIVRFTGDGAYDQNSIYEDIRGTRRKGRRPSNEDRHSIKSQNTSSEGPKPNGESHQESRSQAVEKGGAVSPPGPGRKHVLPIQANPRKPTTRTRLWQSTK